MLKGGRLELCFHRSVHIPECPRAMLSTHLYMDKEVVKRTESSMQSTYALIEGYTD